MKTTSIAVLALCVVGVVANSQFLLHRDAETELLVAAPAPVPASVPPPAGSTDAPTAVPTPAPTAAPTPAPTVASANPNNLCNATVSPMVTFHNCTVGKLMRVPACNATCKFNGKISIACAKNNTAFKFGGCFKQTPAITLIFVPNLTSSAKRFAGFTAANFTKKHIATILTDLSAFFASKSVVVPVSRMSLVIKVAPPTPVLLAADKNVVTWVVTISAAATADEANTDVIYQKVKSDVGSAAIPGARLSFVSNPEATKPTGTKKIVAAASHTSVSVVSVLGLSTVLFALS